MEEALEHRGVGRRLARLLRQERLRRRERLAQAVARREGAGADEQERDEQLVDGHRR